MFRKVRNVQVTKSLALMRMLMLNTNVATMIAASLGFEVVKVEAAGELAR